MADSCAWCGDTGGYPTWWWNLEGVCKKCAIELRSHGGKIIGGWHINWDKEPCSICGAVQPRIWNANVRLCEQCANKVGRRYRINRNEMRDRGRKF